MRSHLYYHPVNSSMSHGTEGSGEKTVTGHPDIQAKISASGLGGARTQITQRDCQAAHNGAVVIQVIGWLTKGADPRKKFVQTFLLTQACRGCCRRRSLAVFPVDAIFLVGRATRRPRACGCF